MDKELKWFIKAKRIQVKLGQLPPITTEIACGA